MIDGFRIEMTTSDLQKHCIAKSEEHTKLAGECETQIAKRVEARKQGTEEGDHVYHRMFEWDDITKLGMPELKTLQTMHKERAKYLAFVAAHLPANEVHRLGREDQFELEMIGTFVQRLTACGGRPEVF